MTSYGLSAVLRIALEQALHGFHEKCSHDAESNDVPFTGDVTTTAGELKSNDTYIIINQYILIVNSSRT